MTDKQSDVFPDDATEKRWNDAVDWLLNSRYTADPEIQAAFWGVVNGQCTRDDAERGYLVDGTPLTDLPNEEIPAGGES